MLKNQKHLPHFLSEIMLKTNSAKNLITVIITVVLVICVCVLMYEFIRIANLKHTHKQLQSNLNAVQSEITNYTDRNAYYADRETFLEEYAREVYNWGKTDRTYFD